MEKDNCIKCRKPMHRMGANVCYPCNFKAGKEEGRKEGIDDIEKEWKTIRRHPNMTGQEVFEKAIAAARRGKGKA